MNCLMFTYFNVNYSEFIKRQQKDDTLEMFNQLKLAQDSSQIDPPPSIHEIAYFGTKVEGTMSDISTKNLKK